MRTFLFGPMLKGAALKTVLKRSQFSEKKDFRLAVDAGLLSCRSLGLSAHFAIGDWDGLKKSEHKLLKGVPHLSLPVKKDQSDLFHGLRMARMLGASELIAVGFEGGRPDHALGVVFEMSVAARDLGFRSIKLEGVDARYQWVTPAMGAVEIATSKGQGFSVFSPLGLSRGWTMDGVTFPVKAGTLQPGTLGLSNQQSGRSPVKMKIRGGVLLTVVPVPTKTR